MALMYAFVQIKQLGGVCSRATVYAARSTETSARIEKKNFAFLILHNNFLGPKCDASCEMAKRNILMFV